MKNEPWIDRLYLDKLAVQEISVDMTHWAQAEAMIVAQEKEKKKRRIIFWLLFIGTCLGLGIMGWNLTHSFQKEELNPSPIQEKIQSIQDVAKLNNPSMPNVSIPEKLNSINKTNNNYKPTGRVEGRFGIHKKNEANHFNRLTKDMVNIKITSSISNVEKNIASMNDNEIIFQETSNKINSPKIEIAYLDKETSLMGKDEILILPNASLDKVPIKIKRNRWKESGIRTTLAQTSGLNITQPSISHAGLEYYHQRSMGTHLFYGYSIGYKSNFNHTQYAQVITSYQFNGFGANVQNFGVKPEWMNALYAQANTGIEWSKHRLILSIKPEFLIGTRGKVDELQFKEPGGIKNIAEAQVSSINEGWLQSGALKRMAWTASLGYEYRIMPRLGIGIQLDRALISPYKPLDIQIKQTSSALWNTGFRVSYILN